MTEVTFFEDYHCFEYHSAQGVPQRFRYCLYSPVYDGILLSCRSSTQWEYPLEKTVYSNDFIPSRVARRSMG